MTAAEIKQKVDDIVKRVSGQALKVLAVEGEKSIAMNFEAGGRPTPWVPRKRISKKQEGRNLLVIRGALKNVRAKILSDKVQLVTDVRARAYAKIQNEGGVINMPAREYRFRSVKIAGTKKTATRFAAGHHRRIIKTTRGKAYQINIPARPFMLVPEQDFGRILNQLKAGIRIW